MALVKTYPRKEGGTTMRFSIRCSYEIETKNKLFDNLRGFYMALYLCGQPGCKGHHTFSENCSAAVVPDYPALTAFQNLLDSQPLAPIPDDAPARKPPTAGKARLYSAYWRED